MSWRVLIGFLLIVAVACWQGGIKLGEWLVNKAPASIASANDAKIQSALDDKSKQTLAEPPQPRTDGTLGQPKSIAPVEWSIVRTHVDGVVRDSEDMIRIDVPKAEADMPDRALSAGGTQWPQGPSDIVTIDAPNTPLAPRSPDVPNRPAEPLKPATPNRLVISWQQALKNDLDQCSKLKFFDRPRCVEQAQRRYCEPNHAWGQASNCPDPNASLSHPGGG